MTTETQLLLAVLAVPVLVVGVQAVRRRYYIWRIRRAVAVGTRWLKRRRSR